MTIILESIASAGLKSTATNLSKVIFGYLSSKAEVSIANWKAENVIDSIQAQIKMVREVKTLWQLDKPVDLTEFFVNPSVETGKQRVKVNCINDFPDTNSLLLEGIAGQGKSILLRYLCSVEIQKGNKIPILIELRRINKENDLLKHIIGWFDCLGVELKTRNIKDLLKKGKLLLFLDAFDEVNESDKDSVIEQIEVLSRLCEGTESRLIVSSRPQGGLEYSSYFHITKLSDLIGNEHKVVIKKLSDNLQSAENLITRIENHKGGVKNLLITPLFVTLLIITYKSFEDLPEQLSDFYDVLFYVLLKRHDGIKPGYKRFRNSDISDKEFRKVFDALCFESKNSKLQFFSNKDILEIVDTAVDFTDITTESERYLNDLVKVTCLIVNDGFEYRFIHKSIQEYFTASFISALSETKASEYLTILLTKESYKEWLQELRFLEEIDKYKFIKYFKLPLTYSFIGKFTESNKLTRNDIDLIYGNSSISLNYSGGGRDALRKISQIKFHHSGDLSKIYSIYLNEKHLASQIYNVLCHPKFKGNDFLQFSKHKQIEVVPFLSKEKQIYEVLCDVAQSLIDNMRIEVWHMEEYLRKKDLPSTTKSLSLKKTSHELV